MASLAAPAHGQSAVTAWQHGAFDWAKLAMSVYVVFHHCGVIEQVGTDSLRYGARVWVDIVVAVFAAISGYLLLDGRTDTDARLTRQLRGTLRLYLFWSALYLPYAFWGNLVVFQNSLPKAVAKVVWGVLVTGINYNSWQMWYLLALAVSIWMIRFGLRHGRSIGQIALLGAALFFLGTYISMVQEGGSRFPAAEQAVDWYYRVFYGVRNGPMRGLLFVCIGILLSRAALSKPLLGICAVGGGCCALLANGHFIVYGLGFLCAVTGIFGLLAQANLPVTPRSRFARELSRYIYLSHMLVYGVVECLRLRSRWAVFGLTLALTMLLSMAFTTRQKEKKQYGKRV